MSDQTTYALVNIQELVNDPTRMTALTRVCADVFAAWPWYGSGNPEEWYGRIQALCNAQDVIMILAYCRDEIVGFTWGCLDGLDQLDKVRFAIANWKTDVLDPVRRTGAGSSYYFAEIGVRSDFRGFRHTVNENLMLRHLSECIARGYDSFLVRTTAISDYPLRWFRDDFHGQVLYGPDDYRHQEHLVLLWVRDLKLALSKWNDVIARRIPPRFFPLEGAVLKSDQHVRYLATDGARYPIIGGIPILLRNPDAYLVRLRNYLEGQLRLLEKSTFDQDEGSWIEAQYARLKKRLHDVRNAMLLSYQGETIVDVMSNQSAIDDEAVQMDPKYEGEPNTDTYTRISWGHLSSTYQNQQQKYTDAGELYTTLATQVGKVITSSGVFLDIGCGVGRTVYDVAQIISGGLAIGMDVSLSKVTRAWQIVRGNTNISYPVREQHGLINAWIKSNFTPNAMFAVGDGMNIQLPAESVDCVVASFVVGVVPDSERLLREIFRVLKAGGSLIIADPLDSFYSYERPSMHHLTVNGVKQLLSRIDSAAPVEVITPVTYKECSTYARTVIYLTQIIKVTKAGTQRL